MKFAMNGALTIGTLDGANIEIREEAGAENFFLFGMNAQEVADRKASGYHPYELYQSNEALREAIDALSNGMFSPGDRNLFEPLIRFLLDHDEYMLLADLQSYVECQERVGEAYADQDRWSRMSILNTARSGKFSSDRAVREYCSRIWQVQPVPLAAHKAV